MFSGDDEQLPRNLSGQYYFLAAAQGFNIQTSLVDKVAEIELCTVRLDDEDRQTLLCSCKLYSPNSNPLAENLLGRTYFQPREPETFL